MISPSFIGMSAYLATRLEPNNVTAEMIVGNEIAKQIQNWENRNLRFSYTGSNDESCKKCTTTDGQASSAAKNFAFAYFEIFLGFDER